MAGAVLYDDGNVLLDDDALVLRRYYFPVAGSKRIPYGSIRGIDVRPNTLLTGKGRLWGTTVPSHWFPLDVRRPEREKVVSLDVGARVRPAFTPAEPDRFLALLRDRVGTLE